MNLIVREKQFMNTTITIKVVQDVESTITILDAIDAGFGEFDRIVKQYTRFNEDSELSNLNRNSGNWVQISKEFFDLMEKMLDLAKKSDGAFDPTIIDFLEIYGYDKNYDFSKLDKPELNSIVQKQLNKRKSFTEIELNKTDLKVKLAKGQRVDLGGIGKGYAIDCAFDKIQSFKVENFLIDAGGDLRANGTNEKKEIWNVGLKHKNEKGEIVEIGLVKLDNKALASSGSWARKVKQFHHLINPKTGLPENKLKTVYVEAPTATEADSWATALFIGGEEIAKKMPTNFKYFYL